MCPQGTGRRLPTRLRASPSPCLPDWPPDWPATSPRRPSPLGERHPLSYGREVLAELCGVPHRADWKACAAPREEEAARTERFKAAFDQYDIMK